MLAEKIQSWDVTEDEGPEAKPLPVDAASLKRLPDEAFNAIRNFIVDADPGNDAKN